MRSIYRYKPDNYAVFVSKLLLWSKSFDRSCILDSNGYHSGKVGNIFPKYDFIAGIGSREEIICRSDSFNTLKDFSSRVNDWLFGFLSYDLKNEIEHLVSENIDNLNLPMLNFFRPEYVFVKRDNCIEFHYFRDIDPQKIIDDILSSDIQSSNDGLVCSLEARVTKKEYLDTVNKLLDHIKRGDIYEINYCQEFFDDNASIDPYLVYLRLKEISPVPFGAFYRFGEKYLMCASPERYLKKEKQRLISQPIKGTAKRGKDKEEDIRIIEELQTNPKERAENIMITDLVRNDLSQTAEKGSVKVEELCGIYTYPQVHQMISTITSELRKDIYWTEAVKKSWPMGSMTGAPKVRAMELIEEFEVTKRGLYSGSVGYVSPEGDFDFNVIIRSLIYDKEKSYLSCTFGGAITMQSIPEKEYSECLLKAKAIKEVFNL